MNDIWLSLQDVIALKTGNAASSDTEDSAGDAILRLIGRRTRVPGQFEFSTAVQDEKQKTAYPS